MSLSPIGDTIAVTQVAYTLYSRVIVVARDAGEQFADLVQDLKTMKTILYKIRDYPSGDRAVEEILGRFFRTLCGLGALLSKYENLGNDLGPLYVFLGLLTSMLSSKLGATAEFALKNCNGPPSRRLSKDFVKSLEITGKIFNLH